MAIKIIYNDWREERTYKDLEEAVFENLMLGLFDYLKLTNMYVKYLEKEKNKNIKQLSEIDMPLMNVIQPMDHLKGKPTIDAIYRYLVKYERFKGAPVWDDLVKYVEDNNINLEGSYFVDLYKEVKNEKDISENQAA